jgi:deoxyribonuclease-1
MRFLMVLLLTFVTSSFATSPNTFAQAKKIVGQLFVNHQQTLYCQCQYDKKQVDLASCGMQSADAIKRAHRTEIEHIMAAEHFGHYFQCWREPLCEHHGKPYKGRACCEKIDASFRHMESELYNLWPAVGLINQARSNYRFSSLQQKGQIYGCQFTIDKTLHRVEPSDAAKGIIARANLFMSEHYGIALSPAQHRLFDAWNKQFPPSQWEITWASHIASIEGYENNFIKNT